MIVMLSFWEYLGLMMKKKLRSYLIGGHGQFFLCMLSIFCEGKKNVGIAKNLVNPTAEWRHRLSLRSLFCCHFHGRMCPLHLYSSGFVFSFITIPAIIILPFLKSDKNPPISVYY